MATFGEAESGKNLLGELANAPEPDLINQYLFH
jgi:hypothetical protein